jgi:hypothetical protein
LPQLSPLESSAKFRISSTSCCILCVPAFISSHESYLALRHVGLVLWQKVRIDEYFDEKCDLFRCICNPVECLLKSFPPSVCVHMKQIAREWVFVKFYISKFY